MKVLKNYLFNSAFQVFQIFLPLITAPYVSRVFGPHGVGEYTFSNSIAVYFGILGVLGLTQYGNRMIAVYMDDKSERSEYFWGILVVRTVTIALSIGVFLLVAYILYPKQMILFWIQSLYIVSLIFDVSWFFNGIENFKITVSRSFIVKIISVVLIFGVVHTEADLWKYALIMVGSGLIGNLTLWPFLSGLVDKPNLRLSKLREIFLSSMIYFIPGFASSVYLVLNKIMIGVLDSSTAAGFFQQSDQLVRVVLSLVTSMNAVLLPRVANEFKKENFESIARYIRKSVSLSMFISVPVMFGLFQVSIPFAPLYFGKGFEMVGIIMAIEGMMVVFIGLNSVVGWQYMMPIGMVKQMSIAVSVGAILNLVLNFILIPLYGVIGATVSTVLAELIILLTMIFYTYKKIDYSYLFTGVTRYLLAGGFMWVLIEIIRQFITNSLLFIIVAVLAGGGSYLALIWIFKAPIANDALDLFKKKSEG